MANLNFVFSFQVLGERQEQISARAHENKRKQENLLREREKLLHDLEEVQKTARREKNEEEKRKQLRLAKVRFIVQFYLLFTQFNRCTLKTRFSLVPLVNLQQNVQNENHCSRAGVLNRGKFTPWG